MKFTVLSFISATVIASVAIAQPLAELSSAAEKSDIFFWGEVHDIKEQSQTLQAFIDESAPNLFESVATEMVLKEDDEAFQDYLNDKSAGPNSPAESKFFDRMRATGYGWIKTHEGQETYRSWWRLKQRKPSIKICGTDLRADYNSPPGYARRVWDELPDALRKFVLKVSDLPEIELREGESDHFREAGMAFAMTECLKGRGRALIHVGAYHAVAPAKYPTSQSWRSASVYLDFLNNLSKKIVTLYNTRNAGEKDDEVGNAFIRAFAVLKGREEAVFSATQLNRADLKEILTIQQPDSSEQSLLLWDLFILGPVASVSTPQTP